MVPYFSKASLRSSSLHDSEMFPTNSLVGIGRLLMQNCKGSLDSHQTLTERFKMAAHAVIRSNAHALESHLRLFSDYLQTTSSGRKQDGCSPLYGI